MDDGEPLLVASRHNERAFESAAQNDTASDLKVERLILPVEVGLI
jgi:hypothetical protein